MQDSSLRKIALLSVVLVFTMAMVFLFTFSTESQDKSASLMERESVANYTINPPKIPAKADFAGESVPLDRFYVREDFDRELLVNTYWHSSTIQLIKRANRWFPVVEPILKENGIPEDFKYLALIESGFTHVVSPRGAAGYWQIMEKTAKERGLEVNDYVDERYNVELATQTACDYFKDSYALYENWTLVAASYNAGQRRITESIEKQKVNSYYDLYLNDETSRYVYRILAAKTILSNPAKYGFQLEESDLYQPIPYKVIEVNQTIPDLIEFAHSHGVTYRMFKMFNPWLRESYLQDASGKVYKIKIPDMKAMK
ncbi:MAG: lytic transglycosylase domain-containing protein [Bacteroidales bacterium]|nr:lytic transglycosylase domain-containing protein [Bacteroidales bacterium]